MIKKLLQKNKLVTYKKSFEWNAMIVFALSMLASGINYGFQIMSGHLLETADYGVANIVFSYVSYLGVLLGPISALACKGVASSTKEEDTDVVSHFIQWIIAHSIRLEIVVCGIGAFVVALLYVFSDRRVFLIAFFVVLLLPTNSFYTILQSIIQGLQKFVLHGFLAIIFNCLKLLLAVLLVVLGMRTTGVVFGQFFGQLFCVCLSLFFLRKYLNTGRKGDCYSVKYNLSECYTSVFLLQIFYFFYINGGDIIVLGLFFEDKIVGEYSAAVTLCKVLFYVVTPITTVLFPFVAEKKERGLDTRKELLKSVLYALVAVVMFGVFLYLLGDKVISFLYGVEYVEAKNFLSCSYLYSIAIIVLSVLFSYQIAIGETKFMTFIIGIMLVVVVLILVKFPRTPQGLITTMAITLIAADVMILFKLLKKRKRI